MGDRVHLIDTTLRDGHQSVWASRMRLGEMLPLIDDVSRAGFEGVEFMGLAAQITRSVRDLHENPFDWIRLGAAAGRADVLRFHGGVTLKFGTASAPKVVLDHLLQRLAEAGITVTRATDPWNNFDRLQTDVAAMASVGIRTVANIIYSISPRHTTEYFEECVRQALRHDPYRLCLKDVGGLLTPEAAADLVPRLLAIAGDVPMELHVHCNNGLGPYVVLAAVDAGIRHVHTAIPPLADGSSQPSVFEVHDNLVARGYRVDLDTEALRRASDHLELVRQREGHPRSERKPYLESYYRHQMPGGMVSNLRFQLEQIGRADRFDLIADEAAMVRAELGHPIMVTPLSQFVSTQAALNVIHGQRYVQVSDEVIRYALGFYGDEAPAVMDQDVRDRILDRPRGREIARDLQQDADGRGQVSWAELRSQFPDGTSDDEIAARVLAGAERTPIVFADPRRAPRTYEEYRAAGHPLLRLAERFAAAPGPAVLEFRTPDEETLHLRR